MDKIEHLKRIRAKCVELLEIAEKRTPGQWQFDDRCITDNKGIIARTSTGNAHEDAPNAAFIASCAGAAEAGWKATAAAVDDIIRRGHEQSQLASQYIAAWPEELL